MGDGFAKFSKKYVLFCHITSHVKDRKHDNLLSEKGGRGFPHLVAMDSAGDVLAEHEDEREADAFERTMAKAREFVDLQKKAAAGDKGAKVKVLVHRLKMGSLSPEEAEKAVAEAGPLSRDQEQEIQGLLSDAAIKGVLKNLKMGDPQGKLDAGKKFLERKKAGKPAPTGDMEIQIYWIFMMDYAETQKDAATYEEALNALKAKFGGNPQAQQFFKTREAALNRLKEGKKDK